MNEGERDYAAIDLQVPFLAAAAFVAVDAVVLGRVDVGEDATIWFKAVARGDTEQITIGRRSNVQDGAVLHADPGFPCTIGQEVTIGHRAIVHGATLADGAMVGMGATVLNGATIGAGAILAAGALAREGWTQPPRTLAIGVPAKVVRELSDEDVARCRRAAEHYVALGRVYAQQSPLVHPNGDR